MNILYAVELGNNENLYSKLKENKFHIERVYYKFALIEELESEKNTIILSQSLEDNIEIEDIIKIFKMANTNSILIIEEKYRDSTFLKELLDNGIYNGVFEDDVDSDYIIHLLNNERNIEQAKDYYAIVSDLIVNDNNKKMEKNIKFRILNLFKK